MGVPRSVTCVVLAALGVAGLSVSRSGVSASLNATCSRGRRCQLSLQNGSRRTGRTGSSPNCSRSTKASRTGPNPSSTTRRCALTTSPWRRVRRRRAGSIPTPARGGSSRTDRSASRSTVRNHSWPEGIPGQVPYRNIYSMETVGDTPSLRLEVNIGGATTMYPADESRRRYPASTS